jgi:hypothetical protein
MNHWVARTMVVFLPTTVRATTSSSVQWMGVAAGSDSNLTVGRGILAWFGAGSIGFTTSMQVAADGFSPGRQLGRRDHQEENEHDETKFARRETQHARHVSRPASRVKLTQ